MLKAIIAPSREQVNKCTQEARMQYPRKLLVTAGLQVCRSRETTELVRVITHIGEETRKGDPPRGEPLSLRNH
jgi:hypothetical protein